MSCNIHNNPQSLGRCGDCRKLYYNTPKGKAETMWYGITQRVNNKDKKHPSYTNIDVLITKTEFLNWAIPELEKWSKTHSIF